MVWLDGLDMPIVNLFDTSFAEHTRGRFLPRPVVYGDSLCSLRREHAAGGLLAAAAFAASSTIRMRAAERRSSMLRTGPLHPCHGVKMRFVNPVTGGTPCRRLPRSCNCCRRVSAARLSWEPMPRSTLSSRDEGRRASAIRCYEWRPRDIFVAPSWAPVCARGGREAVLFSMSDRAAQQALGLWREEARGSYFDRSFFTLWPHREHARVPERKKLRIQDLLPQSFSNSAAFCLYSRSSGSQSGS